MIMVFNCSDTTLVDLRVLSVAEDVHIGHMMIYRIAMDESVSAGSVKTGPSAPATRQCQLIDLCCTPPASATQLASYMPSWTQKQASNKFYIFSYALLTVYTNSRHLWQLV